MSEIIVDKYNLKYSNQFEIAGIEEVALNLELEASEEISSSVIGKVVDTEGNKVSGATVKLFDKDGVPYKHTITDENGNYVFVGLKSNSYSITAVKKGAIITIPRNFFLQKEETKTHDFQIAYEASLKLCSIAGHILNGLTEESIEGSYVTLLDFTSRDTIATTKSAKDGEYVFYDLTAKQYILVASKDGYLASASTEILALDNTVINTDIKLLKDPNQNVGTISGIIKNDNAIVPNAFVGLYSIVKENEKEIEKLIATTRTNASGIYMFGNVTNGKYKVKAKQNV